MLVVFDCCRYSTLAVCWSVWCTLCLCTSPWQYDDVVNSAQRQLVTSPWLWLAPVNVFSHHQTIPTLTTSSWCLHRHRLIISTSKSALLVRLASFIVSINCRALAVSHLKISFTGLLLHNCQFVLNVNSDCYYRWCYFTVHCWYATILNCLQYFDAVGWAAGRASGQ